MCLQLLSHVADAGLLALLDSLDCYQNGFVDGDELLLYITQAVVNSNSEWNFEASLGGYETIRRGELMASQGGFPISRAEDLLSHLWEDRHTFLAIGAHMGPGRQWTGIFFLLVHSLIAQG